MKMIYFFASLLALLVLILAPAADTLTHSPPFIVKASIESEFIVLSSKLALHDSQNKDIRNLARIMIEDQERLTKNLGAIVGNPSTSEPTSDVVLLDKKHQEMIALLRKKKGSAFDKRYLADQIVEQKETIKLFQDYARNGDNKDLKNFACSQIPILRDSQGDVFQTHQSLWMNSI